MTAVLFSSEIIQKRSFALTYKTNNKFKRGVEFLNITVHIEQHRTMNGFRV